MDLQQETLRNILLTRTTFVLHTQSLFGTMKTCKPKLPLTCTPTTNRSNYCLYRWQNQRNTRVYEILCLRWYVSVQNSISQLHQNKSEFVQILLANPTYLTKFHCRRSTKFCASWIPKPDSTSSTNFWFLRNETIITTAEWFPNYEQPHNDPYT